jgi:hypothetical protein
MTQNAKVNKVLNTILAKDDNEIEKRYILLSKAELAQLILFLASTKSLKVELAALIGTWRSRRKEDKGYIMTLPTLLPDAIYVLLSTR